MCRADYECRTPVCPILIKKRLERQKRRQQTAAWLRSMDQMYREQKNAGQRRRYAAAPGYHSGVVAASASRIRERTPAWLTDAEREEIRSFYSDAAARAKAERKAFDVDHIVPLNGTNVSGLNVPWNLQVLTARENRSKSNRHVA